MSTQATEKAQQLLTLTEKSIATIILGKNKRIQLALSCLLAGGHLLIEDLQAALDPSEIRPFHMQMNSGFMKDILFYWDAIDNQWNQWVVGYDKTFQQEILEKLLHEKFSFSNMMLLMVVSFSLMLLVLAFFIIQPFHKQKLDPVIKIYNDFCLKLAAAGIARAAHEGPLDYANRAIISLPEHKSSIRLITHLYTKLRFEASHNERQFKQFEFHVRKFKRIRIKT